VSRVRRSDDAPSWREVFRDRARLTVGLILLESVTAVQLLIVVTIMPVIVAELGGLRLYGWAFSASALAAMISLPATGRAGDRWGPARALVVVLGIFVVGTVLAAAAPNMPVFIVGRFLQGWGLGAQYAVSLGAVAKTYPEAHRPRVLALLSGAWILPSIFGPSFGALLASTVGWRWSFIASLPFVVIASVLVLPELASLPRSAPADGDRVGVGSLVQLAVGAAAILFALTKFAWWTGPLALAGGIVLVPALRRILPPGSLAARSGLPASVAGSFLLSFAFFGIDGFVPLMLTNVRGQSVAAAGAIITLASVAWALGSWWQSRAAVRRSRAWLVRLGTGLIVAGSTCVWAGLIRSVPLLWPYLGWTVAGAGMGIAFPTISLVAMERAEPGRQTAAVASAQLTEALGASLGPGLGGSAVALAASAGASLSVGLTGVFAIAMAAALVLLPLAGRLRES